MEILFPGLMTATLWKILCTAILLPLNFFPLRLLSFTSIIGIFSCFGSESAFSQSPFLVHVRTHADFVALLVVAIVVMDGLLKRSAPGSLLEPAVTHWFPQRWSTFPLSFGLLLSPWGGHSVFPNVCWLPTPLPGVCPDLTATGQIYRDMRHPRKYGKALSITYVFTVSRLFPSRHQRLSENTNVAKVRP